MNHPQNSSAMDSSDPKLSETGLRSTGAFLVVSQLLGDCSNLTYEVGGPWGLIDSVFAMPPSSVLPSFLLEYRTYFHSGLGAH